MATQKRYRTHLDSTLWVLLCITVPFMIWKALIVITGSPSPIVVVISESMAPAFHRGDLLFLWNRQPWIHAGEIPVCWFPGNPLPMVHRAIKIVTLDNFTILLRQGILTKGDNNLLDDVSLYPEGRTLVSREEIFGIVKGFLPGIGYISIAMQEHRWIQDVFFGA
ncbi:Signal peptidase I, partial [Penicillium capsulatum]